MGVVTECYATLRRFNGQVLLTDHLEYVRGANEDVYGRTKSRNRYSKRDPGPTVTRDYFDKVQKRFFKTSTFKVLIRFSTHLDSD